MNNFRLRHAASLLGFCILLGAGPVPTAPEEIPPDKLVHPLMKFSSPEVIPGTMKEPVYPEKWRELRLGARVILYCVIEESGSAGECKPAKTDLRLESDCDEGPGEWMGEEEPGSRIGPPEAARDFEAAALDAVKEWKFLPGTRNGKPVAIYLPLIVQFSLCPKKADPQQPPHP